ncbi:MAG: TetR family transcriptional regulator [Solirubrobacterales bacterium]|nr:TetR family transcriptional regulator [Solirubrobacterales bacterium]
MRDDHTITGIAATEGRIPELRADAARNRALIVAAATKVFAEHGLEASTSEIARSAGVGEATLFRRFPTKDDLILAIVQTQMDEVIAVAEECLADDDPWRSIERFFSEMIERRVSDQGVSDAAKDRCMLDPGLDDHRRRIMGLMNRLVERAQEAGVVRDDLRGADLGLLMAAASSVSETPFPGLREDIWKRYLGVILDGMRPQGATRLRPGPPPRRAFERPER